jgi:hypothetical protein
MAANMVKNLVAALRRWPIASVTVWVDRLVALFWIASPERSWKVFVSNRTRKIAEITEEVGISWKYCPDLGSRGASIDKMEKDGWFNGPEWLVINPDKWPKQPKLERKKTALDEQKPMTEVAFNTEEKGPNELDMLLSRSSYWKTIRITAWALGFVSNVRARKQKTNLAKGPLTTNELEQSNVRWLKKVQEDTSSELRAPGWEVIREGDSGLLKRKGRILGYQPRYTWKEETLREN